MARLQSRDPTHPDRVVAEVELLSAHAIQRLVASAYRAQPAWMQDAPARAAALTAWANAMEMDRANLATLIVAEVGKPIKEARAEVERGIRILSYYAQAVFDPVAERYPAAIPTGSLEVLRHPLGLVLIITPWNFPVAIPLWKAAAALAYGNAVLFRPSSLAPAVGLRLGELAQSALPDGAFTSIPCSIPELGRLVDDPVIDGVSFTGSTAVGYQLIGRVLSRAGVIQAEMGGQNPSVVLDDADLYSAARTIASAAMAYAGQKCTATSRVIIDRQVAEDFIPLLCQAVESLVVGDPTDELTDVGPLISADAREAVAAAVTSAGGRGARLMMGGNNEHGVGEGWYYPPTLLALDSEKDEFAQEETFGPAASLLIAESTQHALEVANSTRFGLSGSVFGRDLLRATSVAQDLKVGLARVNASTAGVDYWVPFGGDGISSFGPREQGKASREFFTQSRTVLVQPA